MRFDFKSRSCFSGVSAYPGLAVVRELGSDGIMLPWILLVMFLHLPFAIWLSLVLAGAAVSDGSLSWYSPILLYQAFPGLETTPPFDVQQGHPLLPMCLEP